MKTVDRFTIFWSEIHRQKIAKSSDGSINCHFPSITFEKYPCKNEKKRLIWQTYILPHI